MFSTISWLFFDVGSTLVDERAVYAHRMRELAGAAAMSEQAVYETAMNFYRQNQKGDIETAKLLGVPLPAWHKEDELLYADAEQCLKTLHRKYRIGIIANQSPGTAERLRRYGILPYIDHVGASAEEGVAKPDRRIFEIALERSHCRPENAVMIGDRIDNDIIPAKRLGMYTVWIRQGFGQYWRITSKEEQPDAVVENLTELCGLL